MMDHIFISYSRKDEDAVNAFTGILRAEGITVWQDNSGSANGIPFSSRWMETIEQAIHMAGGALIFVSDNWMASVPCNKEKEIIVKCDIPFLELMPDKVAEDPQHYLELVRKFCDEIVLTAENRRRTELFYNAGEYRSGMDPNHLIKSTRGITGAASYLRTDISAYKKMMLERNYAELNPELYPYMKQFVNFANRTARFRIVGRIVGTITAVLIIAIALFSWRVVPSFLELEQSEYQVSNLVNVIMAEYSWECSKDPAHWISNLTTTTDPVGRIGVGVELVSVDTMSPLLKTTSDIDGIRMPLTVIDKYDERYETILKAEAVNESDSYKAEFSRDTGSIYVTERSTGTRRTISTTSAPGRFAWSPDGRILAFSSGCDVFVYDAAGQGSPFHLSENFKQIKQLKFIETEADGRCVAAVTSGDRIALWKDPLAYTAETADGGTAADDKSSKKRIRYGIFCDSDDPAAIYLVDDTVVLRTGKDKYTGQIEADSIYSYALSHDENMLAYICKTGEVWEIIVADISELDKNGGVKTIQRVRPEYEPTDIAFSTDDSSVYASARNYALMKVDIGTGEIRYSDQDLGAACISGWGNNWVLTSFADRCYLFSSDMELINDKVWTDNTGNPFFDIVTDESHGYIFSVNRGGGSPEGSTRLDPGSERYDTFEFDPDERTASSTAVALSKDDEYVAFGYSDGSVRIFETVTMILVEEKKCMGESIVAMRFSDDGSMLSMLGSTGDIYSTPLTQYLLNDNADNLFSNFVTGKKLLIEKQDQYYNGLKLHKDMF